MSASPLLSLTRYLPRDVGRLVVVDQPSDAVETGATLDPEVAREILGSRKIMDRSRSLDAVRSAPVEVLEDAVTLPLTPIARAGLATRLDELSPSAWRVVAGWDFVEPRILHSALARRLRARGLTDVDAEMLVEVDRRQPNVVLPEPHVDVTSELDAALGAALLAHPHRGLVEQLATTGRWALLLPLLAPADDLDPALARALADAPPEAHWQARWNHDERLTRALAEGWLRLPEPRPPIVLGPRMIAVDDDALEFLAHHDARSLAGPLVRELARADDPRIPAIVTAALDTFTTPETLDAAFGIARESPAVTLVVTRWILARAADPGLDLGLSLAVLRALDHDEVATSRALSVGLADAFIAPDGPLRQRVVDRGWIDEVAHRLLLALSAGLSRLTPAEHVARRRLAEAWLGVARAVAPLLDRLAGRHPPAPWSLDDGFGGNRHVTLAAPTRAACPGIDDLFCELQPASRWLDGEVTVPEARATVAAYLLRRLGSDAAAWARLAALAPTWHGTIAQLATTVIDLGEAS